MFGVQSIWQLKETKVFKHLKVAMFFWSVGHRIYGRTGIFAYMIRLSCNCVHVGIYKHIIDGWYG